MSAFLTAVQTYLLQRNVDTIREVYSWLLGRLATAGWHEVLLLLPYAAVTAVVVLLLPPRARRARGRRRRGGEPRPAPAALPATSCIAAASLGTAAAVSVSGLIGFVGIIVPHTVRLLAGSSYRAILPLSLLFGGAFLALADLVGAHRRGAGRDPDRRGHRVLRRAVLRARAADARGGWSHDGARSSVRALRVRARRRRRSCAAST